MAMLIIGLVIFLGIHSLGFAAPRLRPRAVAAMGEGAWKGLYAVVSIVGLVLIVRGFALAREAPVVLYTPPSWMRHVTFLLMLPVFPLILAAYFPGRIKAALKHPMLAAVKFWALAHLLSNGTLADVLLFGSFLAWAVLDRISWKRRPPQQIHTVPARALNDVIAVIGGIVLYAIFIFRAHLWLFGVSPLG
ncbi:MAG TPA: NnrU family protein [Steroidobacteraceae bacterium]|jgi:uncharacterized membrane protein|nr:NnrU family protein [Steroidobacteraceae bacterium]